MNNADAPPEPQKKAASSSWLNIGVVIFAIIGLFTFLSQCSKAFLFLKRQPAQQQQAIVKKSSTVDAAKGEQLVYSLRYPSRMGNFMMFRLRSGVEGKQILTGHPPPETWNYLFVNIKTGKSHWLWDAPLPLVADQNPLGNYSAARDGKSVEAQDLVVTLVEKDTNGNMKLDREDEKTIAVIGWDGKTVTKILENYQTMNSITSVENGLKLLMYEKGGKSFSAFYDQKTNKLLFENELPLLKLP